MAAPFSSGTSELRKILLLSRRGFLYAGLFSAFINLLMLTPTFYMLQVYDRVVSSRSIETLIMITLIALLFFAVMGLLEFVRSRLLVRIGSQIDQRLNDRIFGALFSLGIKSAGQANAQALDDLTGIRQFLTGAPMFAFFDAPWVPLYLALLFLFHPVYGYFAVVSAVIVTCLAVINEWVTKKDLALANTEAIQSRNLVAANLRNAEVIHAMGMLPALRRRWLTKHLTFLSAQSRASDRAGVLSNLSKSLRMISQSLILGLGGYLAIKQEISSGMIIAGSIVMGRALAPVDLMIGGWKQFATARISYQRLSRLLEEIPKDIERMSLPTPQGRLSVEGVVVTPPGAKAPVLRGPTFVLEPGESLGLIGPSAAGKSTLARAILGVWPLAAGKVRLDGADISLWNHDELGPYIGYLPQDIELFSGTIAENIARFGEIDAKKVVEAARLAGVHEMILTLPDGYDTPLGMSGGVLSGGQRQRIGLARAVYGLPRLLVLDEPNSNLDDQGEMALAAAVGQLKAQGSTLILISHRAAILNQVDKVLLLNQGQIQLYGPRAEVLARLVAGTQATAAPPVPQPIPASSSTQLSTANA